MTSSSSAPLDPLKVFEDETRTADDLAKTKRFLEEVTKLVPSIIYVFNQESQSNEYANRNLAKSIGYSDKDVQALGADFMPKLMHPDDLPKVFAHFEKTKQLQDGEYAQIEYRMKHQNGSYSWLLSTDTVFDRNETGQVRRHIGVASDITEQKEAQLKLQQINAELEQRIAERTAELSEANERLEARVAERTAELTRLNKELEELAYVATHDMKAPINNIQGFLKLLQQDETITKPSSQKALQWIHTSVENAQDKIIDVVAAVKARTDHIPTSSSIHFNSELESALAILSDAEHRCKFDVSSDFSRCPSIYSSKPHISSIIQNLLSNALKYRSPERKLQINVESWPEEEYICLSVADNGIGINLERDHAKIFGLFKRAVNNVPGSGLGLYIIKQTITRMGGKIDVESLPDQGAKFIVRFPKEAVSEGNHAQ